MQKLRLTLLVSVSLALLIQPSLAQSKLYAFTGIGKGDGFRSRAIDVEYRNRIAGAFEYGAGISFLYLDYETDINVYFESDRFSPTLDLSLKSNQKRFSVYCPISLRYNFFKLNTLYISFGIGPEFLLNHTITQAYTERSPNSIEESASGNITDIYPRVRLVQGFQLDLSHRRFIFSIYSWSASNIVLIKSVPAHFQEQMPYFYGGGLGFYTGQGDIRSAEYWIFSGLKIGYRIL